MPRPDLENEDTQDQAFDSAFDEFSEPEESDLLLDSEDTEELGEEDGQEESESDVSDEQEDEQDYKKRYEELEHRFKSDIGRQSAYQSRIAQQEREIQQLRQQSAPKPLETDAGENPDGSNLTDEQWGVLKEEFPEIAEGIESQLKAYESRFNKELSQVNETLEPIRQRESQQLLEREFQALADKHPDYEQVASSTEFNTWLSTQPQQVQKMIESSNAADAAWLLDGFKRESGPVNNQGPADRKPSNNKVLERSRSVPRRGTPKQSVIAEDDFDAAFDHFADKN